MPQRLLCSHLRVDVGGEPVVDGLSLESTGEHVLVLRGPRGLFEAAAALRDVVRGEVLVEDASPSAALEAGLVASAPLDPPMPPKWTVLDYTTWSARLAGHKRAVAFGLATDAVGRMQLTTMAVTKLAAAPLPVRRATVIAAALATGAPALLIEDPMSGLSSESALLLARAVARGTADRRTTTFAGRVPLESPLALACDEAIVLDGAQVVGQGPPAEIAAAETTLALRVHGQVDVFVRAVEDRGGRATASEGVRPVHVRVELGPLSSRDLFAIATESNAVVMELRPLAGAFA
jgi:ABC-type multidrug transport system ATPase subunit